MVSCSSGYEPTKEELQHMVNEVDKGHSGKLSFKNFTTAIARKVMSRDSDADIMKSFRLFDNDDVGTFIGIIGILLVCRRNSAVLLLRGKTSI